MADKWGGAYMIYALILGMAVRPLVHTFGFENGINFTARIILRWGVALLGAKISYAEITALGGSTVIAIMGATVATILFGIMMARLLGLGISMGVLTGGATGICGASACMAISSVLPQNKLLEQQTLLTVVGVNVISTIAMIVYPTIALSLNLTPAQSGIFLGGSIHDVAQVVGAGFAMGNEQGVVATVVKLLRVALLLPIVFAIGAVVYWVSKTATNAPTQSPPVPWFLVGFLALVALNSMGYLATPVTPSQNLSQGLAVVSQIMLTTAVVALGIKTNLKSLWQMGAKSLILLLAETVFIAGAVLGAVYYMGA